MATAGPYSCDWIVAFVRPWDALFFKDLAETLQRAQPTGGRPRLRYLTFWKETETRLRRKVGRDDDVIFLPDRLKEVSLDRAALEELVSRERRLLAHGMTPLKTMMECERFAPSSGPEAEAFMWRSFKALDELIPVRTILLSNQVDHVCYWIACELCNARDGRHFGFCGSGRPSNRTQVLKNATQMWTPRRPEERHFAEVDQQILEISGGTLPAYMQRQAAYPTIQDKVGVVLSRVREARSGNYFMGWRQVLGPARRMAGGVKWRLFGAGVRHHDLAQIDRPFVYFPLHLEPEASTSVYAPFFKYQGVIIDWLAKALPAGVDLVLKENPKMWGLRARSFYRDAARHPGVRWIDPRTPSRDLTLQAAAVITITGTVALEALALEKPVAIFGAPPYSDVLSCIPRIRCPEDLGRVILELLEARVDHELFRRQYAAYIANLVDRPFNDIRREPDTHYPVYSFHQRHADFLFDALRWNGA